MCVVASRTDAERLAIDHEPNTLTQMDTNGRSLIGTQGLIEGSDPINELLDMMSLVRIISVI